MPRAFFVTNSGTFHAMTILINIVLPVFLIAGIAAAAQLYLRVDVRSISRIAFYLFSPALVLNSLINSQINSNDFARVAVALLVVTGTLWVIGAGASRLLSLDESTERSFLIAILLTNSGNFGLPLNLFAFGDAGLAWATVYYTVAAVISSSLGVYIVARRGRSSISMALRRVAGVPLVYAAGLGLLLKFQGYSLPEPLYKSVQLLAQAAVPAMLVVLGIQMASTFREPGRALNVPALSTVTGMRLFVAPALALLVTRAFALPALGQNAFVLQSAMPSAVITTILATEFEADSSFVTLSVFVTTAGSLLTVALLLNWLL